MRAADGLIGEVLREILTRSANTLRDKGAIDERESLIDTIFAASKEGVRPWGSRNVEKDLKTWQLWIGWLAPVRQYARGASS